MAGREAIYVDALWVEKAPLEGEPAVAELGCTSAPLLSASFHLSQKCKAYNEDFLLCKKANGDPEACLKEGRRVTRCAADFIAALRKNCEKQWDAHWQCLDAKNQTLHKCRPEEKAFNECVFDKFGLTKTLPTNPGETPVHLKEKPYYS
ncbi:hypothetical protein CXG81DRAFT_9721 [Caulochytrium protostelioides]|uniref:NADH-ubiquinone oxidoreductase n=1 Tax=Caulochytrium protostelioides TaxID=1555241 RepID=A0A4V1IV97_9FUNG|nr:hypothetical protein CXG81DRAFT_9721 [Caulochytrium protostelioides]|eukprot:RKP03299.1 hypothetical protein CXG81DRAFT_9721 [Caulochytrium protostelioides]